MEPLAKGQGERSSWIVKASSFSSVSGQECWAGKTHLGISPGAL